MKLTIDRPMIGQLESFLEYLKDRGTSPDHEENRDLIADFIDKVMIFELKRMTNEAKTYSEEIEIPESLLMEPLRRVKRDFDRSFERLLGGGLAPMIEPEEDVSSQFTGSGAVFVEDPAQTQTKRNGNGHKSTMTRKLNNQEKDLIRSAFVTKNGQFADDDCVKLRQGSLDAEVAIFQVTGFVSYLHREIAAGVTIIKDLPAYEEWMRTKYGKLWAQYNNPQMVSLRTANQNLVANGFTPKFAAPPKRA